MKIFTEFQKGGKVGNRDFVGLNDVQIINKFFEQHSEAMKISKFITSFKHDHAQRFAEQKIKKSKQEISYEVKNPET